MDLRCCHASSAGRRSRCLGRSNAARPGRRSSGRRFTSPHRGLYALARTSTSMRTRWSPACQATLPPGPWPPGSLGCTAGVEPGEAPAQLRSHVLTSGRRRDPGHSSRGLGRAGRGESAVPEHCWTVAALELNLLEPVQPVGDWLIQLQPGQLRSRCQPSSAPEPRPSSQPGRQSRWSGNASTPAARPGSGWVVTNRSGSTASDDRRRAVADGSTPVPRDSGGSIETRLTSDRAELVGSGSGTSTRGRGLNRRLRAIFRVRPARALAT